MWENPNKNCGCIGREIMGTEIQTVAGERRREDGVEKCQGGHIDRVWCPER